VLQVDPRFNRTSHIADVYPKMRSGTDIAFLGGMINYSLARDRVHWDYVRAYTTAALIDASNIGLPAPPFGAPRAGSALRYGRCCSTSVEMTGREPRSR
jgi:anaerobic selenocysteine-containing dehydrogenase